MKKIILLSILILITSALQAQFEYPDFRLETRNDSIICNQLRLSGFRAQRMANTAVTMTILGAIGIAAGIIIDESREPFSKVITGSVVSGIGTVLFSVGIPLWITEVSRLNKIEIEMIKYSGTNDLAGLGVKLTF